MNCMEYLLEATKEAKHTKKSICNAGGLTLKQVNSIDNAFQLRSIAYSLAVIADKLSGEGERNDRQRVD